METLVERVTAALVTALEGSVSYFAGPLEKVDMDTGDARMTTEYCIDGDVDLVALARAAIEAMPLKLYVWEDCLTDWTSGAMFALATSEDEAKAMVLKNCDFVDKEEFNRPPKVFDSPIGYAIWGGA